MRALIRGKEAIIEPFSQWVEEHLDWMIGRVKEDADGRPIVGGGYTLIEDYVPPVTDEYGNIVITEPEPEETFEINGRTYTKSELLELLK